MCVCIMCMLSMRDCVYNRQKSKKGMTMGEEKKEKKPKSKSESKRQRREERKC